MKNFLNKIHKALDTLANCVIPSLPIIIGVGMIRMVLMLLGPSVFNVLKETSQTYIVLSFVADAGFYFLPIYVAVSSAEALKTNKYLAALMGGVLLSPKFVELVNQGTQLSIFNLPIASTTYENQILPSIILVFFQSYVYKFFDTHINDKIKDIFVPLLTIMVLSPIALCVVGPLGVFLNKKLVDFALLLCKIGPLGNAIFTAMVPFMVITGLASACLTIMLAMISIGPDPIAFFANVLYNTILGVTVFAIYLKEKKSNQLASAITAAIGGISEPAIFGIVLKDSKAFFSLVCGCFVGGLFSGILKVKSFAVTSFGFLGVFATIGPGSSIILALASILAGSAVSFIIAYITHKKANRVGETK